MKPDFLERIEERFVFKVSRYFFHTLVGITVVAMAIAIIVILYGLIPSMKRSVSEPVYPKPAEISLEELSAVINPKQAPLAKSESTSAKNAADEPLLPAGNNTEDPANKEKYEQAYTALQQLIPPEKYPWDNVGYWRRNWYRNEWVISKYGVKHYLKEAYQQTNANNYEQLARLINSYVPVVRSFEEADRMKALTALTLYSKDDVPTTETNIQLLDSLMRAYGSYDANILYTLAEFGKKNPRDGAAFLEKVAGHIGKFNAEQREKVLGSMINAYYSMFNNRVDMQIRISELFLPLLPNIESTLQDKALVEYYKLYLAKNQSRESEIARLEAQYQRELEIAQQEVAIAKAQKSELRLKALTLLIISIGTISLLALLLVLLSMQRQLKALRSSSVKENETVTEMVG